MHIRHAHDTVSAYLIPAPRMPCHQLLLINFCALKIIANLAARLEGNPDLVGVAIVGYTCKDRGKSHNRNLVERAFSTCKHALWKLTC